MTNIDVVLLFFSVVVGLVNRAHPRRLLWLTMAGLSYTLSATYMRTGLPYAAGFAGLCDGMIVLAISLYAKERWEMLVGYLFAFSVAINLIALPGIFASVSPRLHSDILEAINWILLAFFLAMPTVEWLGSNDRSSDFLGIRFLSRYIAHSLRETRKRPIVSKERS